MCPARPPVTRTTSPAARLRAWWHSPSTPAARASIPRVRNHEPIEVAVPARRQVVAVLVLLLGVAVLAGWVPLGPGVVGVALLLVALGLFV